MKKTLITLGCLLFVGAMLMTGCEPSKPSSNYDNRCNPCEGCNPCEPND